MITHRAYALTRRVIMNRAPITAVCDWIATANRQEVDYAKTLLQERLEELDKHSFEFHRGQLALNLASSAGPGV